MPSAGFARFAYKAVVLMTVLASAPGALAQDSDRYDPPAHVQYLDGSATLERDGQVEPLAVNLPVVAGDRVHTSSGRVDLLLPDGSSLDIDQDTTVDVEDGTLFRVDRGRIVLTVIGAGDPSNAIRFQFDTPAAAVETDGPGEYRVSVLRSDETELAVTRGYAYFSNERGSIDVLAGERSVAFDGGAPERAQSFNSARFDPFDRWVAERRNDRVRTTSTQYLPRELQVYGAELDRNGSWQYDAQYGNVWYPRVAADWRPYYTGYWDSVPSYGWTWIGVDAWSWPTHHYGRWGHARSSWFWIPGRSWGPAWVSWASAGDYVSWCPLGYDGRPVFSLSVSLGSSWLGWTVLPRTVFGFRDHHVNRYAIRGDRLPRSTAFVAYARSPISPRNVTRTNIVRSPDLSARRRFETHVSSRVDANDGSRRPSASTRFGQRDPRSGSPETRGNRRPGGASVAGSVTNDAARRRGAADAGRPSAPLKPDSQGAGDPRSQSVGRPRSVGPASPARSDDRSRQPLSDSGRRRSIETGTPQRPVESQENRSRDGAVLRSRGADRQNAPPAGSPVSRGAEPSAPSARPPVIYHRGQEQAPAPSAPPVFRRAPEGESRNSNPEFRRAPAAEPRANPAVRRGPESAPSRPAPERAPEPSGGRGGSGGGERASPKQAGASGDGGHGGGHADGGRGGDGGGQGGGRRR